MNEVGFPREKNLRRIRRLSGLAGLRREIVRCYEELRATEPDPVRIQHSRALVYILSSAADVIRDETLTDIENRLAKLEREILDKRQESA